MSYSSHPFKKLPVNLIVKTPDGLEHKAGFRLREPEPTFKSASWQRRFYLYLQWREGKRVREVYLCKVDPKIKPKMREPVESALGRKRKRKKLRTST